MTIQASLILTSFASYSASRDETNRHQFQELVAEIDADAGEIDPREFEVAMRIPGRQLRLTKTASKL